MHNSFMFKPRQCVRPDLVHVDLMWTAHPWKQGRGAERVMTCVLNSKVHWSKSVV